MVLFYIASFFGGAFFVNALPHFISGVSGRRFPTPFAKPPGVSESSPIVNVLWGSFNVIVAYFLLCKVADFNFHDVTQFAVTGIGGLLMALMTAHHFGRVYDKK